MPDEERRILRLAVTTGLPTGSHVRRLERRMKFDLSAMLRLAGNGHARSYRNLQNYYLLKVARKETPDVRLVEFVVQTIELMQTENRRASWIRRKKACDLFHGYRRRPLSQKTISVSSAAIKIGKKLALSSDRVIEIVYENEKDLCLAVQGTRKSLKSGSKFQLDDLDLLAAEIQRCLRSIRRCLALRSSRALSSATLRCNPLCLNRVE